MKRNNSSILVFIIISLLVLAQVNSIKTLAQDTTDEDVEESNRQKTIAENEKAIAEAKKAKFDALFPKPDVSSLVGGTKINEGTFIETQILGYCAMKSAAKEISGRINELPNRGNLVVYNEADVKMVARYTLMMNRLKNIERGYHDQFTQVLALIRTVDSNFQVPDIMTIQSILEESSRQNSAGLIIDTALKFLSLLKTDIEITPSEIAIGEKELVAEVFSNLNSSSRFTPYYPQTIPLSIQDCSTGTLESCSPLLNQIMLTSEAHDKVAFLKLKAKEILDDVQGNERANKNINDLNQEIIALDLIINNPATKKKEREAKQREKNDKLDLIRIATQGIQARNSKYNNPGRLTAFRDGYGVFAGKIEILNKTFKITMEELGFTKEPETPTPTPAKTATPTPTPCTGKDCPQTSLQTTNVNVNVGDKEEKKDAASGGGGDKTFASYLQAESLKNVMSQTNSRWLEVKVIKAGGNLRVRSNIYTNLVVGSRVNFSGGAIVYFNVFDKDGKSEKSGVVSAYNGYQKSSKIIGTCDQGEATRQRRRGRL